MSTNTLGRYRIIREIARSNDIVYEAMDPSLGKKIALKELHMPANLAGQARRERIQRFTREARAAAGLQHPNIVRIFEHGQIQDRYYIAMEFLEGQSLRDVLRQRGALPVQEALRIAAAVADGVDFAHRNGVIHRDVKPDNVHLEPDGRVVITDFGIARLTFEPTLTADGQIFGTPSYMSPEQVAGKGIDRRSDIFSLGVMLYEMLAGRKPFTGDSVITITYNIMNLEPPPVPGAPPGLDQIIRCAMAKDPDRRYATAAQMAEDLRLVAQGASPRHAVRPRPDAARSLPPRPPAAGPPPGPAAAPGAARPLLQPVFGSLQAPPPGMVPGVRPLPVSGRGAGSPAVSGAPGAAVYPAAAPAPPPSILALRQAQQRAQRQARNANLVWLFGWLGVAVVIAVMIMAVVWASVTAYDRFRLESAGAAVEAARSAADRAFQNGRYPEALEGYLRAAASSSGQRQVVAKKNAAVAAVQLATKRLEADRLKEAGQLCRQALNLNPDLASAYVVLGRVLAQQGRVDESVEAFDQAEGAARRSDQAGASREEVAATRSAASSALLWKADVLYQDGVRLLDKNPRLARQRLEATIRAAPDSDFARNARAQLARLAAGPAAPASSGSRDAYRSSGAGEGAIEPPAGWDFNYGIAPGGPGRPR